MPAWQVPRMTKTSAAGRSAPPRGEPLALEKAVRVERVGDRVDLLARHQLAVAPHHRGLDVGDRVLAVEEGDDLETPARQEDDRVRVARGGPERDARASLVL